MRDESRHFIFLYRPAYTLPNVLSFTFRKDVVRLCFSIYYLMMMLSSVNIDIFVRCAVRGMRIF